MQWGGIFTEDIKCIYGRDVTKIITLWNGRQNLCEISKFSLSSRGNEIYVCLMIAVFSSTDGIFCFHDMRQWQRCSLVIQCIPARVCTTCKWHKKILRQWMYVYNAMKQQTRISSVVLNIWDAIFCPCLLLPKEMKTPLVFQRETKFYSSIDPFVMKIHFVRCSLYQNVLPFIYDMQSFTPYIFSTIIH